MAETSGFFNSLNGDRLYTAEQITTHFEGLISNGVYANVDNGLQIKADSGMTVSLDTGKAVINNHWYKNDALLTISINQSHVTLDRYTIIILRLDKTERKISVMAVDGENASSPTPPKLTRSDTIYDVKLASIKVTAGMTNISQSNIVDTRPNTDECGFVTGLIQQVDTSDLFLQWQTAYEEFFSEQKNFVLEFLENLTTTLNVKTIIKKFQNTVVTTEETDTIDIGITEYDSTEDVLLVHINGVLFVEGDEYTIQSNETIVLTNTVKADNTITFIVLKATIADIAS